VNPFDSASDRRSMIAGENRKLPLKDPNRSLESSVVELG
jgi:hypothetical protein